MIWAHVLEFGERVAGREYPSRPGSYAVIFDVERRHIAVVHTPEGCFLPGGGWEPGETPEQSLRREVAEECGLALGEALELGKAVENVRTRSDDRCFRKEGVFFVAAVGVRLPGEPEHDHVLAWLTPEAAVEQLTHRSQAWVVRRVALPPLFPHLRRR